MKIKNLRRKLKLPDDRMMILLRIGQGFNMYACFGLIPSMISLGTEMYVVFIGLQAGSLLIAMLVLAYTMFTDV